MSTDDLEPKAMLALSDNQQIRAYAHPTRMAILEVLGREKQSVSRVARILGVHPANLTHHFKLLERAGLIRLVEKRETGKNLEKLYRAAAVRFVVNLEGEPLDSKKALALSIARDNLNAAIQSLKGQDDGKSVFGLLKNFRMKPQDIARFHQKLTKLLEEFEKNRPSDGEAYTVNISFYPGEPVEPSGGEVSLREEK
jgi:DNA-binding transcriptional ArsR family regulator